VSFINTHRERWGIEPICRTLQVAPSTYYAAVSRQPSARQLSDEWLKTEIGREHRVNFGVYGIEKVWRQLNCEGVKLGRDRVARLMDDLDLSGVVRGKKKRTTIPDEVSPRPADLVERNFTAAARRCQVEQRDSGEERIEREYPAEPIVSGRLRPG